MNRKLNEKNVTIITAQVKSRTKCSFSRKKAAIRVFDLFIKFNLQATSMSFLHIIWFAMQKRNSNIISVDSLFVKTKTGFSILLKDFIFLNVAYVR